jgi:hypothetical protein
LCVLLALTVSRSYTVSEAEHVVLTWKAPATNEDGTPLSDLAGFRVYYWQDEWEVPERVDVGNHTSHTLTQLEAGHTYNFAVTSYDISGNESELSEVVSASISRSTTDSSSSSSSGGGCTLVR